MANNLLTVSNTKTMKGEARGYLTAILHLAPHDASGLGKSVCPWASAGCIATCLNTAGRGMFNSVQQARINKTKRFFADRTAFLGQLSYDIAAMVRKAEREGLQLAVRLNGTSDLPWESFKVDGTRNLMQLFPAVQFYDYTKSPQRMRAHLRGDMPPNYHLTFSRSECNDRQAVEILARGGNVAVVFDRDPPSAYAGRRVVSGDETDLRFLDPRGVVVGLTAKGKAKRDTSGFVIRQSI